MHNSILERYVFVRSVGIPMFIAWQRIAYVYRAKKEVHGTKVRVIWGYVSWYSTLMVALFIDTHLQTCDTSTRQLGSCEIEIQI